MPESGTPVKYREGSRSHKQMIEVKRRNVPAPENCTDPLLFAGAKENYYNQQDRLIGLINYY